jgi:cAMP-dependent protein kinase regulator
MVLDWFTGSKASSVNELIVQKEYPKAIELISAELEKNSRNERLRLQLAHVLALAERKDEAVEVLDGLAGDLARDGFATKAVAILKKILKLSPERGDIDERLVSLIGSQSAVPVKPWVDAGPRSPAELEIGEPSPVGLTASGAAVPPPEKPSASTEAAAQSRREAALGTPLFRGMSPQEVVAVIRGLRLLSFDSGHILVTEGEPGDSLFVLTTGRCRAFVRNPAGRNVEVRELIEGDFFGEISVLTGQPRSATVTIASPCELLELDRGSLDSILAAHPHVQEVLEEFHSRRAESTIEAAIRTMQT